ncbi:hypothetical protein AB0D66_21995 [Streptomyces sp. NPDC048270]|uniref:hypothetical protein n=1 Tax=Streptomyces sp. NPDC048270 TaxID=3154615 RepID=UPI0033D9AED4
MPNTAVTPVTAADLRAAIDFQSEYVIQVRDRAVWIRPEAAEHRVLHGIDVWHAIRRAPRYTASARIGEHGILTLDSAAAEMRFIPQQTYEELFCSAEDCEKATADGDSRDGRCDNCATRAYAVETAGEDEGAGNPGPAALPAALRAAATEPPSPAAPYSAADLRTAAASIHQMLLLCLDAESGVGEGIGDHLIPHTVGTAAPRTWQSLGDESSTAYRAIRELLDAAPDLARWAVGMAGAHLVPDPVAVARQEDGTTVVRLHLAFADHITADQRAATRTALHQVLHAAL